MLRPHDIKCNDSSGQRHLLTSCIYEDIAPDLAGRTVCGICAAAASWLLPPRQTTAPSLLCTSLPAHRLTCRAACRLWTATPEPAQQTSFCLELASWQNRSFRVVRASCLVPTQALAGGCNDGPQPGDCKDGKSCLAFSAHRDRHQRY